MTDKGHKPNTFILAQEITGLVPFSPNHLRRLEARGDFPRRIRIGANRIAWLRDEVEQWLADRVEAR
ncbi:AlpA family phage regulatory protein [Rhodobacterales bacterium FZCC0188]|nr:AlpA family phage regulatory protein [Rhodobacterales bacterium FZCC0188]